MSRLYVDPARLGSGELVVVGEEDHRYLVRVLRLGLADQVTLFDGRGREALAEIARLGPRAVELRVLERREVPPPRGPTVTLIQGLARGDKLDLVVEKATELGVQRIQPVSTARAVPQLDQARAASRRARWQKIAAGAARQSGRADVPEVDELTAFAVAVRAVPQEALKLLFWEGASGGPGLRALLPPAPPPAVALAVGPEGGFTDEEVEAARAEGFRVASLGPRILRTETAGLAALAVLGYVYGDLG